MKTLGDHIAEISNSPAPWLFCVVMVNRPTAADHGLITPIPLEQALETNLKRLEAGEDPPLGIIFIGTRAEAAAECNRLVAKPEEDSP